MHPGLRGITYETVYSTVRNAQGELEASEPRYVLRLMFEGDVPDVVIPITKVQLQVLAESWSRAARALQNN